MIKKIIRLAAKFFQLAKFASNVNVLDYKGPREVNMGPYPFQYEFDSNNPGSYLQIKWGQESDIIQYRLINGEVSVNHFSYWPVDLPDLVREILNDAVSKAAKARNLDVSGDLSQFTIDEKGYISGGDFDPSAKLEGFVDCAKCGQSEYAPYSDPESFVCMQCKQTEMMGDVFRLDPIKKPDEPDEPGMGIDERVNLAIYSKDPKILDQLASDKDEDIRYFVAENENTPPEALKQLVSDDNENIRYFVAKHKNTPAEALKQLAADDDKYVRQAVANNKNTPDAILKQLILDSEPYIRDIATNNLKKRPKP